MLELIEHVRTCVKCFRVPGCPHQRDMCGSCVRACTCQTRFCMCVEYARFGVAQTAVKCWQKQVVRGLKNTTKNCGLHNADQACVRSELLFVHGWNARRLHYRRAGIIARNISSLASNVSAECADFYDRTRPYTHFYIFHRMLRFVSGFARSVVLHTHTHVQQSPSTD